MTSTEFEKLKANCYTKITNDEKHLHQDNCNRNYVMKSSDAVDPAWAKLFVRKERVVKYITQQREEIMLVTIQEPVLDKEVIPANEECDRHFDTKFLLKKRSTSELFENEIAEFPSKTEDWKTFSQSKNNKRRSS